MLSGLCEALAGDGGRLSLLARRASAWRAAAADAFDCDYHDEAGFTAALEAAVAANGPAELAVAWIHTLKIPASRRVAERTAGRLFQVLGSAAGDPARPEVLELGRAVADGLPDCRLRQVVLGFQVEAGRSRWLTDAEISDGVLAAIRADHAVSTVGQTQPWSDRP